MLKQVMSLTSAFVTLEICLHGAEDVGCWFVWEAQGCRPEATALTFITCSHGSVVGSSSLSRLVCPAAAAAACFVTG
jgi:hypothetical protein